MSAEYLGVPDWWLPYVRRFLQLAYPIGEDLDVTVTSWHRTRSHNAEVGGQPQSQHLVATAWDITGPDRWTYSARAKRAGLTTLDEGDHIHVQLFRAGVVPSWIYDQVARA